MFNFHSHLPVWNAPEIFFKRVNIDIIAAWHRHARYANINILYFLQEIISKCKYFLITYYTCSASSIIYLYMYICVMILSLYLGTRHITRFVYNMGSLLGPPPPKHTHTKRYNGSVVYRVHTRQSFCHFSTACVCVVMILSCTNIHVCFPSTAGILLILGSQIVSASQMVIEEAFLKSRALHPLHVCIQI